MADIFWEIFESTRCRKAKSQTPLITITSESGRISLNAAACDLISNFYSYSYVEIYRGMREDKLQKICLKLTNEKSPQSIPLSRKKYKAQYTTGAVIHVKALVKDIYTAIPTLPKTCRFKIDLFKHPENNRLVFDIENSQIS